MSESICAPAYTDNKVSFDLDSDITCAGLQEAAQKAVLARRAEESATTLDERRKRQ